MTQLIEIILQLRQRLDYLTLLIPWWPEDQSSQAINGLDNDVSFPEIFLFRHQKNSDTIFVVTGFYDDARMKNKKISNIYHEGTGRRHYCQ